jgi:type II secretory pathway pseudopilin PulG
MSRGVPNVTPRRGPRAGFSLVEITVAAALLAALTAIVAPAFAAVERGLRRAEQRAQDMQALENLIEEFTGRDWDAITDEQLQQLSLPEAWRSRRPAPSLSGQVVLDPALDAKRVTLQVQVASGGRRQRVSLTTWVFRNPATPPAR